jgi:hypothetical protein
MISSLQKLSIASLIVAVSSLPLGLYSIIHFIVISGSLELDGSITSTGASPAFSTLKALVWLESTRVSKLRQLRLGVPVHLRVVSLGSIHGSGFTSVEKRLRVSAVLVLSAEPSVQAGRLIEQATVEDGLSRQLTAAAVHSECNLFGHIAAGVAIQFVLSEISLQQIAK